MRCTFVPVPGVAQPGNVVCIAVCMHGPACAFSGAYAIVIENFDEKPVTTVVFVPELLVSSGVSGVTSISGAPTAPAPTIWWQTRLVGGELLGVVFQSPWKTVVALL